MSDEAPETTALPPVAIEAWSGPLDLLLHLIRVNEVSITDIPIAEITAQYTAYLDAMRELDLDVASDYVALAAELIYIKSKMLLPRAPGEPEDPRQDLAERLREYERFKQAAENLHEHRHAAGRPLAAGGAPRAEVARGGDARGLALRLDRRLPESHGAVPPGAPAGDGDPAPAVLRRGEDAGAASSGSRRAAGALPLLEFLGEMRYRAEAVTAFLATLELIRLGVVTAYQAAAFGEIHVSRTEAPFSPEHLRDEYR